MTVELLSQWFAARGLGATGAHVAAIAVALAYMLLFAVVANLVGKMAIRKIVHPLLERTVNRWDDELVSKGVLVRFSHIIPAVVLGFFAPQLFAGIPALAELFQSLVDLYLIVIILFILDGVLNVVRSLWERSALGHRYPAKSFTQAAKLVINLVGLIFILATLLDKSPLVFFSGLGAVTAVLLLIFRDAILGLVAGFQLSVNNMVAMGDWIQMPAQNADGTVVDVSLTTVKVQNWDKTITTLPSYMLISDSFKNWRGMSEVGGRRIKRAIHIDLRSIRFADEALLDRCRKMRLLRDYLEHKLDAIQKYNDAVGSELEALINGRRLTNVGTFRAYCLAYLSNHPKIRQDLTLIVRQLAPGPTGLPIEIYAFANDTEWANYEGIQSDIFDHLLSCLPEFELSAFQNPSGADLEKAGARLRASEANGDPGP